MCLFFKHSVCLERFIQSKQMCLNKSGNLSNDQPTVFSSLSLHISNKVIEIILLQDPVCLKVVVATRCCNCCFKTLKKYQELNKEIEKLWKVKDSDRP